MTDQRPNPHADAWKQFKNSTTKHELTVVHDDGLYRHLRMGEPGTGIWSWNIVTWPWHLYVGGDIGSGFVFSREEDMFGFFRLGSYPDYWGDGSLWINPQYWSEKLDSACRNSAFSYDERLFLRQVESHLADAREWGGLSKGRAKELLAEAKDVAYHEETARDWLNSFRNDSSVDEAEVDLFADSWEWTLRGYDHHFILALYAITATIRAYSEQKAPTA